MKIWNIHQQSGQLFVDELQKFGAKAILYNNVQEAVDGADIICVVNNGTTPLLDASWIKQGAHINGKGV